MGIIAERFARVSCVQSIQIFFPLYEAPGNGEVLCAVLVAFAVARQAEVTGCRDLLRHGLMIGFRRSTAVWFVFVRFSLFEEAAKNADYDNFIYKYCIYVFVI